MEFGSVFTYLLLIIIAVAIYFVITKEAVKAGLREHEEEKARKILNSEKNKQG